MMTESDSVASPKLAVAWLAMFALATIVASLFAKYLMMMGAIFDGVGMSRARVFVFLIPGTICTGLMFAGPIWSAMFFTLTRFSRPVRLIVALSWFAAVLLAQYLGSTAIPELESPRIFRPEILTVLPIATLGWCIPFVLMHVFRGWQIQLPNFDLPSPKPGFSIASLLTATLLVGLCFAALRLGSSSVQFTGLMWMLMAMGFGFVAVPLVWCMMQTKHYFLFSVGLVSIIYAALYFVPLLIYGPAGFAFLRPLECAAFVQGVLALLVGARLYGANLTTQRGPNATCVTSIVKP